MLVEMRQGLLTRFRLRHCTSVGRGTVALGVIWVRGRGKIFIGEDVVLDGSETPIELGSIEPDAEIHLGNGVHVGGGASIEAVQSVRVGAGAHLGRLSKVMDSNFHELVGDRHRRPKAYPVTVGEGARIGDRAVVLPGSDIGARAVVGHGAVVSKRRNVPADARVSGNPAVAK